MHSCDPRLDTQKVAANTARSPLISMNSSSSRSSRTAGGASKSPRRTPAGRTSREIGERRDQLHFELLASVKLLTEFTTPEAALVMVATCWAEGLEGSAFTAFSSELTDD